MHRPKTPIVLVLVAGLLGYCAIYVSIALFAGELPWIMWLAFGVIWGMGLFQVSRWVSDDIMRKRWAEWARWVDASNERIITDMAAQRARREASTGQPKADGMPLPPRRYENRYGSTLPPALDQEINRYV